MASITLGLAVDIMRYLPLIFLFGILFNCACVLLFRFKLQREYSARVEALHNQLFQFSSDALKSIDDYFISNSVPRGASSPVPSPSSSLLTSPKSSQSPEDFILREVGDWDFHFYRLNGNSFARVGFLDFAVGDRFPRGGVITAIYPDSVVVNDSVVFRNRSFASRSPLSSSSSSVPPLSQVTVEPYKPIKEIDEYVKRANTVR